ncbi:carbohydrate ABC transporter permease [Elstera cyanobacteriorum]|uniref:carbohydrate ABC transporter permease n=1 Tax=Elstera cyanobacteriorum TaxID=2022747 RepID=UPI002357459E|nr:sugar ABC transporter permease [Elstera cyanobacteriorum]MCK6444322.1 sugar ABC transporter permease [Elstera cyanobacteriorum]
MAGLSRRKARAAWIFLAPMLITLAAIAGWPLLRTFWFSLTDASMADLSAWKFIGFDNYLMKDQYGWGGLLVDSDWWRAVYNTLVFTILSVTLETIFGLLVALVLHQRFFGRSFIRAAILVPWAIPTIVSAKIWAWMLHDQFGILNSMMLSLGLITQPIAWAASPDTALAAIVLVDVWKTTPFMALLCLAALQMLPTDCYEAARLDGIPAWRLFFKVTLPLIRPALMVAVIFRALDALRVFDVIYVLTSNTRDTMSMSVFARQHLVEFQSVGYGSAASTALFMVIALLTALYLTLGRVKLAADPN